MSYVPNFTATHKHIGAHEYARKQATIDQLKAAHKYLTEHNMRDEAALVKAELDARQSTR